MLVRTLGRVRPRHAVLRPSGSGREGNSRFLVGLKGFRSGPNSQRHRAGLFTYIVFRGINGACLVRSRPETCFKRILTSGSGSGSGRGRGRGRGSGSGSGSGSGIGSGSGRLPIILIMLLAVPVRLLLLIWYTATY